LRVKLGEKIQKLMFKPVAKPNPLLDLMKKKFVKTMMWEMLDQQFPVIPNHYLKFYRMPIDKINPESFGQD
jgi:hypothetical protein